MNKSVDGNLIAHKKKKSVNLKGCNIPKVDIRRNTVGIVPGFVVVPNCIVQTQMKTYQEDPSFKD